MFVLTLSRRLNKLNSQSISGMYSVANICNVIRLLMSSFTALYAEMESGFSVFSITCAEVKCDSLSFHVLRGNQSSSWLIHLVLIVLHLERSYAIIQKLLKIRSLLLLGPFRWSYISKFNLYLIISSAHLDKINMRSRLCTDNRSISQKRQIFSRINKFFQLFVAMALKSSEIGDHW